MSLQDSDRQSVNESTGENTGDYDTHRSKIIGEQINREHDQTQQSIYEKAFHQLIEALQRRIQQSHFKFTVVGENSQFTRFNSARVKQSGQVCDGQMSLTLISGLISNQMSDTDKSNQQGHKTTTITLPFVGDFETDWNTLQPTLNDLQQELLHLPIDPYVVLPLVNRSQLNANHSRELYTGNLLPTSQLAQRLLTPVKSLDFSGLYASGYSYRGYGDSADTRHWFETPSFTLDYSLFGTLFDQNVENSDLEKVENENNRVIPTSAVANTAVAAVKGTIAGRQWQQDIYLHSISTAKKQLNLSTAIRKRIPRGRYRTYLTPAAVAELIDIIACGGGLGESALRQSHSAFGQLEDGVAVLSEQFSLSEDFQKVGRPRFNGDGEIAPMRLPVIQNGRWANALVNGRSEQEYGKPSNGANRAESLRAAAVAPGNLPEKDILKALDTGLYVSNLHYLNWSDLTAGHITGMTRYACFWVENGEIVAPIENLRFDDDLYSFLDEGLLALTDEQTFIPAVGTYDRRSLGGMWVPGMLIEAFRYTL